MFKPNPSRPARSSAHGPCYAALASQGGVECVIAFGFDDGGDDHHLRPPSDAFDRLSTRDRIAGLSEALRQRGYLEGPDAALRLLPPSRRHGVADTRTIFFSRPNALTVGVAADRGRSVGLVVRVIGNPDGHGGAAAAASFVDGLKHAAICIYMGHWRYGLGPDFDPALAVEVCEIGGLPSDPRRLAEAAGREAKKRDETTEVILDRWLAQRRIRITRTNAGRVVFGRKNLVPHSPTARLVHWIADRSEGPPAAGVWEAAEARQSVDACPQQSLWILLSCRSSLSFAEIRGSLTAAEVGLIGMPVTVAWREWEVLPWILDAFCAQGGWREILGVVDGRTYGRGLVLDGFGSPP